MLIRELSFLILTILSLSLPANAYDSDISSLGLVEHESDANLGRTKSKVYRSQSNRILTSTSDIQPRFNSDSSCLSKTEQHKYWKKTFLNPQLDKVLDDYEKFHRACREKEGNLSHLLMNQKPLPCKYFFYKENYNGMGNKLLSLISAYLFSILTDRVLLVDESFPFEDYFCPPFANSSLFVPPGFSTDKLFWKSMDMMDFKKAVEKENGINEMMNSPPYSLAVHLCENRHPHTFCSMYVDLYENIPVLMFRSNQYYVTALYRTKYKTKLKQIFPDNVIFAHLGRRFMNPTNEIWTRIKTFYDEKLGSADRRFGMQIRPWERTFRMDKALSVLECARRNNFLPFLTEPANQVPASDSLKPSHSIACLVSSLETKFYDRILAEYDGVIGQGNTRVTVHKFGNSTEEENKNTNHNKEAISDIWLLSFCEDLVVSAGSTFGYIATSLAGIIPHFFNKLDPWRFLKLTEPCSIGQSIEPCIHFPAVNFTCPDGQYFENRWIGTFINQCWDFPRGAQVVVPG